MTRGLLPRGTLWIWAAAALPGCKRMGPSQAPVEWQAPPPPPRSEALDALAPPWEDIDEQVSPAGPLVVRLREPDSLRVHLRVLLPLPESAEHRGAALQASAWITHARLLRALRSLGARVAIADGADRVELVVHVAADRRKLLARRLAPVLTEPPSSAEIRAARRVLPQAAGRAVALAVAESILLGRPAGRDAAAAGEDASPSQVRAAWLALHAPTRAVLVVHEPRAARDPWLDPLLERWRGEEAPTAPAGLLARLRPEAELPAPHEPRPLLGETPPPLWDAGPGPGGGEVVIARRLELPKLRDRALARLAARLLAQGQDVRLALRGDVGVLVLRIPLPPKGPAAAVRHQIELLSERVRQPWAPSQIRQAARAFLGARVVQASLDDEDWTGLWSRAIDLSTRDADIARALADEARAMQDVAADDLAAFLTRWCDPLGGEAGWQWVLAGGTRARRRELADLAPSRPLPSAAGHAKDAAGARGHDDEDQGARH